MPTSQAPTSPSDLFNQAVETFQTAIRTGAKVQEESTRRFTELLRDFGSPADWQKNAQSMVSESIVAAQKNVGESIRVIQQNAQAAMSMMQKAFETRPTNGAPQGKSDELWESALAALRTNTQVVLEANSRLLESWTQLVQSVTSRVEKGAAEAMDRAKETMSKAQEDMQKQAS